MTLKSNGWDLVGRGLIKTSVPGSAPSAIDECVLVTSDQPGWHAQLHTAYCTLRFYGCLLYFSLRKGISAVVLLFKVSYYAHNTLFKSKFTLKILWWWAFPKHNLVKKTLHAVLVADTAATNEFDSFQSKNGSAQRQCPTFCRVLKHDNFIRNYCVPDWCIVSTFINSGYPDWYFVFLSAHGEVFCCSIRIHLDLV